MPFLKLVNCFKVDNSNIPTVCMRARVRERRGEERRREERREGKRREGGRNANCITGSAVTHFWV